jgi:hypothetical protein
LRSHVDVAHEAIGEEQILLIDRRDAACEFAATSVTGPRCTVYVGFSTTASAAWRGGRFGIGAGAARGENKQQKKTAQGIVLDYSRQQA